MKTCLSRCLDRYLEACKSGFEQQRAADLLHPNLSQYREQNIYLKGPAGASAGVDNIIMRVILCQPGISLLTGTIHGYIIKLFYKYIQCLGFTGICLESVEFYMIGHFK